MSQCFIYQKNWSSDESFQLFKLLLQNSSHHWLCMVKIHNFTLLIYIIYSTILNLCYMQIFFFAINLWGFYISWIENPLLFWETQWCILTNCRLYWYRYRPKFYNNWLSVFLQKAQRLCQTTGTNQNFFVCWWHFSGCYLFKF